MRRKERKVLHPFQVRRQDPVIVYLEKELSEFHFTQPEHLVIDEGEV